MTTGQQYRLNHITDFAKLSREQFKRMLLDFAAWFDIAKQMQEMGIETTGFTWVDDDEPGAVREIKLTLTRGAATKEGARDGEK